MKKFSAVKLLSSKKLTLLLLVLVVTATFPAVSRAASISFGPYFYYAAWEPFYKDNLLSKNSDQSYTWGHKFTMPPAPLYGFTLGFSFAERWNVAAVFVTGKYISRFSYLASSYLAPIFVVAMGGDGTLTPTRISSRQSTDKYDLDTTLSYMLNGFMKVFVGFKYQRYTISEGPYNVPMRLDGTTSGNYWIYNNTQVTYNGYSGGVGVSFNTRVVENLYFFFNVSGLYQYPQMTSRSSFFVMFLADGGGGGFILPLNFKDALHNQKNSRLTYNAVGGNLTASFAYQIPSAYLTLSLGGRYQYLYFMGSDNGGFMFKGKSDHYYGGTFSAIFTLDLTRRAKSSEGSDS